MGEEKKNLSDYPNFPEMMGREWDGKKSSSVQRNRIPFFFSLSLSTTCVLYGARKKGKTGEVFFVVVCMHFKGGNLSRVKWCIVLLLWCKLQHWWWQ